MSSSKPEETLAQELSCPICLQLYRDPVVLPCGHNYCRVCISKSSDAIDGNSKVLPRCPECREEFSGVDSLQRNFKLCNIIEGYRSSTALKEPESDPQDKTGTFCDYCIDDPSPAVKTCLKCEVSLCSRHLQKHQEKESFRNHSIVEPQGEMCVKTCAIHSCPLEYFCSNDMTSLCAKCFVEGHHQNHDVLTFSVAEEEMRRALGSRTKVLSTRLQLTQSLLQKVTVDQGVSEAIGEKIVNKAVSVMDSIVGLVDRYRDRLLKLLEEERGQRRKSWQSEVNALEESQQQLLEVQRKAAQVLNERDTCLFIRRFMMIEEQLRDAVTATYTTKISPSPPINTKRLQTGLKTLDFRSEMTRLIDTLHILLNPQELSFNVCTAHPNLNLSTDLCTVRFTSNKQSYMDHPERFMTAPQVLCNQGFSSDQHVWVVEVGPNCMWSMGVCYKSIPRRGDHSRLGHNTVSWRLQWKNSKFTACNSSSNVVLAEKKPHPTKLEMALDYEGGTLTFHSIKGSREHLYTFKATFKEPVFPAFSIHSSNQDSWITLQNGV
ncbi:E3 ubiquitin/ISG15 ligase TRIM25 [Oryzias melastigma]|uniref:E3 ubiquitin/ISG15 ligase TRIM25-like n=1 Tax=Oryzias melastigma TaxID=30732 RepID=A0A3B3DIT9_ORYME|nr:E3 ubiquitin/ISG15 ligase TRIM25 [Oryzias melastigma]